MVRVLDVRTNFADLLQQIDRTRLDQLPQAMSWTLNACIDRAKPGVVAEMQRVFDRPTPFTLNALYGRYSSKRNLVATLELKDNRAGSDAAPGAVNKGTTSAVYLRPEIEGGARQPKRMEQALRSSGLLPAGMFVVPGGEAPLDQYGNVPGSFITRVLSDLQSFRPDTGKNRAGRRTGRRASNYFFSVPDPRSRRLNGHLKPGIYWHMPGGMLVLVFHYTRAPQYRARFDFYGTSEKLTIAAFRSEFPRQWARALATDRNRPLKLAA